jgi:hypothetical protein
VPLLSNIWIALKQAGAQLAIEYLSGNVSFDQLIADGVKALKSEANIVAPQLKAMGEATLTTMLRTTVSTALAAASGNPTSTPASSPAAPSSASSEPSSTTPAKPAPYIGQN